MKRIIYIPYLTAFFLLTFISFGIGGIDAMEQPPADEVRLTADDPVANAEFGRSVAIDGNLVAVGAGGAAAGSVENAGAVYLFKRQGLTYVPEAKLVAPDATNGAEFGRAVAIQGNMVIVGARFAQVEGFSQAGAAYVFRKYGGSWHLEEKITSPTPADEDNFGRALAVHGDLLVITARKEAINEEDVGAAYVYYYRDGKWMNEAKLTASDASAGAYFGQSVTARGDLIAIGARNADPKGAGAVYLFRQSGNVWGQVAKLTPPGGNKNDHFGFTVAMVGDVIAVGARRADPDGLTDAGAAYVFSLEGDSFELIVRLTASDTSAGDEFGQSIALAGDVIAVGAWKDDIEGKANQGSIYLFHRMGNLWLETEKLTASDGLAGDEFGYSLSAFGNDMVTGAHFADFNAGVDSNEGASYVIPLKP